MAVVVVIFILVVYFFYIINKLDKHIKELNHENSQLKLRNDTINFDKNRYRRILKEIHKTVYVNDYNNEDFQLKKIKEILIQSDY